MFGELHKNASVYEIIILKFPPTKEKLHIQGVVTLTQVQASKFRHWQHVSIGKL